MANQGYPLGRQYIQGGGAATWHPTADTIKACLVANTYTPNLVTDQFLNNLGANRVGTDQALAGKAVTNGFLTATNVTFPLVPGGSTVAFLVVYKLVGDGSAGDVTSPLIVIWDTIVGWPFATGGTDVVIAWNASGLFRV